MRSRWPALLVVALTYVFQLMAFRIAAELAYSYHHFVGDRHPSLPSLTADFSLPVIGPGGIDGGASPLHYAFWAFVFVPPAILALLTWRESSDLVALQRFVYWGSAYALLVGLGYTLALFGLWLPFSAA